MSIPVLAGGKNLSLLFQLKLFTYPFFFFSFFFLLFYFILIFTLQLTSKAKQYYRTTKDPKRKRSKKKSCPRDHSSIV